MTELDLFGTVGPFSAKGSDTSEAAAKMVEPTLAERQRRVLDVLRTRGPSTGEEVAVILRTPTYRVLPRLTELKRMGLARKTDERRVNASGASATVWRAK